MRVKIDRVVKIRKLKQTWNFLSLNKSRLLWVYFGGLTQQWNPEYFPDSLCGRFSYYEEILRYTFRYKTFNSYGPRFKIVWSFSGRSSKFHKIFCQKIRKSEKCFWKMCLCSIFNIFKCWTEIEFRKLRSDINLKVELVESNFYYWYFRGSFEFWWSDRILRW